MPRLRNARPMAIRAEPIIWNRCCKTVRECERSAEWGTLKTRDWKTRDQICRGGKGRTSVYGTRND